MIEKLINPIYRLVDHFATQWSDRKHYKRSIQGLNRLDDHLLDDIGMHRINGHIVSSRTTNPDKRSHGDFTAINGIQEKSRRRRTGLRSRHPYIIRRR